MDLFFQFNQNWYVLFFGFLLLWVILLIHRKSHRKKKEVKEQFFLAFAGLFVLSVMEIFAISVDLWNYFSDGWPIILWPTYFVGILFGYQLLRTIEGIC
jgi:glucan phosphoethanolaminetransferase (alkaline phosphatase superfamily)